MSASSILRTLRSKLVSATSTIQSEIADLRKQIQHKRAEVRHAEVSPIPPEEVHERIVGVVTKAGAAWLTEHGQQLIRRGDERSSHALCSPATRGRVHLPDLQRDWFGAIACGAPELAVQMLQRMVDRVGFEPGPAAAERPALLARLRGELLDLETTEEQAIDQANAAGVAIAHRQEVVQRRQKEEHARQFEHEKVADHQRRQDALDAAAAEPRSRVHESEYLKTGRV